MHDPRTLLQRLRNVPPAGASAVVMLQESIRDNVESILASRRGDSVAELDFGMPDVASIVRRMASKLPEGGVDAIVHALKEVLRVYEPRLTDVRIQVDSAPGEPGVLVFRLTGRALAPSGEVAGFAGAAKVHVDGGVHVELAT